MRAAAACFRCSASTVWFWVNRARGRRLDRVDWEDRPRGLARAHNRTTPAVERRIVAVRRWLGKHDPLGYVGPEAIRRHLVASNGESPAARTIARILGRKGILPQKRRRHVPPAAGWYLPDVVAARAELDELDVVEGLQLRGHGAVEVLTGVSLWGKLSLAVPTLGGWTNRSIAAVLDAHWRQWGAPAYLQMDNDTRFAGSTRAVRRLGRLIDFCLNNGVVPVFAPPRETGFQAAVESFNALWQQKVWQRFRHRDPDQLLERCEAFIAAHRRLRNRGESLRNLPGRAPAEHVIFLRRTDARGRFWILGQQVTINHNWPHRLVRATLHVTTNTLQCHGLRRRDPRHQPHLKTAAFEVRSIATF